MTEEQRAELDKLKKLARAAVAVAKADEEDWYMAEHFPRLEPEDAAFIAAASPTVFLDLLATIARLEAEADDYRETLIHADLKIRSLPGTDQSDVEFIRARLSSRAKDQSQ